MKTVNIDESFIQQDIKSQPLTNEQLEELHQLSGSYEALFNKRARLYKERGLKDAHLEGADFKSLLLEHYTFLKRPVFIIEDHVFIGNSKATLQAVAETLNEK